MDKVIEDAIKFLVDNGVEIDAKSQSDSGDVEINGMTFGSIEFDGVDARLAQEPADLGINLNDQLDEAPASEPVALAPLPSVVKPVTPVSVAVKVPAPAEVSVEVMLAEASYRPNNIVLLLDVSSSMRKDGKLDRLKAAAARLIGMMRPIDG